ncbi:MAG: histone deacetylase [Myxococcota bacterium]|nr:histone deacetylase [Myxococcota bacterium]
MFEKVGVAQLAAMSIYHSSDFILTLPDGHRFPMEKYRQLHDRILQLYPSQPLLTPPAALERQLVRVHAPSYVRAVLSGDLSAQAIRRIGFPWSPSLVARSRHSVGATIAAGRAAAQTGRGINLAGGTHHAAREYGAGYCVFNDIAVASRAMQTERRAQHILVLDFDVHQGDGTASIFADDESVCTVSVHGEKNYPFKKVPSNLDIALADGASDDQYLDSIERAIAFGFTAGRPDLIFYLAGADPFAGDKLGRLNVSKSGLATRDQLVFEAADQAGIGVATSMGGGYAPQVGDIVDIHLKTVEIAMGFGAAS